MLGETVCMYLDEYYLFAGITVFISMSMGFAGGAIIMARYMTRKYSIRRFTTPLPPSGEIPRPPKEEDLS